MIVIETTKEDLELARAEIEAFAKAKKYKNYFFTKEFDYERLTLANFVYKPTKLEAKTFKFIDSKPTLMIRKLIKSGAKVQLNNPEKIFKIINGKLYELIYSNPKDYLKRHPKLRPGFHPGACLPKLAKVMVNLSQGKKILDPFCGTGGILIEGAVMNLDMSGSDINKEMLDRTKLNLKYYNLSAKVKLESALDVTGKYDAIVTELPFGKTTIIDRSVKQLFYDFLVHAKKLTNKMVVVVPDGRYQIKGWKIEFSRKIYIHKSLSKKLYVLNYSP